MPNKNASHFRMIKRLTLLILVALPLFSACGNSTPDRIDLTTMNSTMVYAYVNDMVNGSPSSYLGKTIRVQGVYQMEQSRHFIFINDAAACCTQGIEFRYAGQLPSVDESIIIEGIYARYEMDSNSFFYIDAHTLIT